MNTPKEKKHIASKTYLLSIVFSGLAFGQMPDNSRGNSIVTQPDGKKITVKTLQAAGSEFFLVSRYANSGVLDTSFNSDGSAQLQFEGRHSRGFALSFDGGAKSEHILVGGGMYFGEEKKGAENLPEFALARLSTSGVLDTTFHTDGMLTTLAGGEVIRKVTVNDDSAESSNDFEIVAWGCPSEVNCDSFVAYHSNGSLSQ